MCRSITALRGLEPAATPEEVRDAARQFVRKVGGVTTPGAMTLPAVERAIDEIAAATTALLAELPPRRTPPKTVPPRRRPSVQARASSRATSDGGATVR